MHFILLFTVVAQLLGCVRLCDPMNYSTPGFPIPHYLPSLLRFMSIESVMPSNHLLCCSFFSWLQSFPISGSLTVTDLCIRWPKCWSFSISPSNEYSGFPLALTGLISLAVLGTLKSLLQQHSSKASILQCSAFFIVQLSHPYMTIGKTIALTIQTFVGKVMSLLFNMLSRFIIAILPRSKHLLISWLQLLLVFTKIFPSLYLPICQTHRISTILKIK